MRGTSCVGGCLKCFKGIAEKAGEYERWKNYDIKVVGMDDCGDCPGLVIPKVALMMDMGKLYERQSDAIHLGTCIMKATQTAKCPLDLEDLRKKIGSKFNKEVIIGTHPY